MRTSAVLSINLSTLSMVSIFSLSPVEKASVSPQIFLSTLSSVSAHQSPSIASHWFMLHWDLILVRYAPIVELKTSSMVISVFLSVPQEHMPSHTKMEVLLAELALVNSDSFW